MLELKECSSEQSKQPIRAKNLELKLSSNASKHELRCHVHQRSLAMAEKPRRRYCKVTNTSMTPVPESSEPSALPTTAPSILSRSVPFIA